MIDTSKYGLWQLVIVNSFIVLFLISSFFRPQTRRDWRTFGVFSAFVVALFSEMYDFPLSIYLLSGWLGNRFPTIDGFSHNSGHLLQTMLGWQEDPHFSEQYARYAQSIPRFIPRIRWQMAFQRLK